MLFILSFFVFLHPLHISVTEINYSEKDNSFQVTSRIFIDDLEAGIRHATGNQQLDLLNAYQEKTTDQLVSSYLATHLLFKINGASATQQFIGCERDDLSLVCYIELTNIKRVKSIQVSNSVLIELYSDQSNLVHVNYKSPIKSARLMANHTSELFTFDY